MEEILPDETAGYVVLPMEASFSDLSMELVPDGRPKHRGAVKLHVSTVSRWGSARASLSDHYIKRTFRAAQKDVSHKDQETEDGRLWHIRPAGQGYPRGRRVALLLILITALIRITRKKEAENTQEKTVKNTLTTRDFTCI